MQYVNKIKSLDCRDKYVHRFCDTLVPDSRVLSTFPIHKQLGSKPNVQLQKWEGYYTCLQKHVILSTPLFPQTTWFHFDFNITFISYHMTFLGPNRDWNFKRTPIVLSLFASGLSCQAYCHRHKKGGGYGKGMLIAHNFSSTQDHTITDNKILQFRICDVRYIFHATSSPFKRGGSFPHAVPWNEIVLTPSWTVLKATYLLEARSTPPGSSSGLTPVTFTFYNELLW